MTERLVVVGNCQAGPLAGCLRQLNPSLEVKVVPLAQCKGKEARERALEKLNNADVILMQPGDDDAFASAGVERLSGAFSHVISYPKLTFRGFHPDFCVLSSRKGALVRVACGTYHSVLTAAAFANGISEPRVLQLFNSFIFARLGYFENFAPWKNLFLTRAREIGYELEDEFETWLRRGAFMHTWKHPAIRVLASIAVRCLAKAELECTASPRDMPDPLARATRLPVYRDIARSIGIDPIGYFHVVDNKNKQRRRDLSMEDFVRECYSIYRGLDPVVFDSREINAARTVLASEIRN